MSESPFHQGRPMMAWHERLESAQSVEEVCEACAQCIASLGAVALSQLPRECIPPAQLTADSISEHALTLVRYEHQPGANATPLVRTLAMLFTDAAAANARIAARWRKPGWDFTALRR